MKKILLFAGIVLTIFICSNRIEGQTAVAQQHTIAKPGDRIRLKVAGEPGLSGKYDHKAGDSIAIRLGTNQIFMMRNVPINQIIKIEVSQKPRFTPFQKILIGALIGASAGAVFGLVVPESPAIDHGGFYNWTRGGTVLLWGAVGAGCGAIVGIVVAAASPVKWSPAAIAEKPLGNGAYSASISVVWRIPFEN